MVTYQTEIQRVFNSMEIDFPNRNVDFERMYQDWREFFTNRIPPEYVWKSYENVLEYKAANNNTYPTVTKTDMLAAYLRIKNAAKPTENVIKCEICNGTKYFNMYNPSKNKDEIKKCQH